MRDERIVLFNEMINIINNHSFICAINCENVKIVDFSKIKSEIINNELKCRFIKNSIFIKAIATKNSDIFNFKIKGNTFLVYGNVDYVDIFKILAPIIAVNKNLFFKFCYCIKENKLFNNFEIKEIVSLPSKEILIGKLFNILTNNSKKLLYLLSFRFRELLFVLQSILNKKESN